VKKEWGSSIEGILYNLSVFGAETTVDEADKILIAKTLQKIPEEVREKVLNDATFILAHGVRGTVFEVHLTPLFITKLRKEIDLSNKDRLVKLSDIENLDVKMAFILLNFSAMENEPEDVKMSTIAHEIAHFILGHHKPYTKKQKAEKEADDLIVKWGFKRVYNL